MKTINRSLEETQIKTQASQATSAYYSEGDTYKIKLRAQKKGKKRKGGARFRMALGNAVGSIFKS